MPCLGCTEPEFPFHDLAPGTVFKTPKIAGVVPVEHQTGTGRLTYLAHAVAARIAAPQWSKEDMFVV
jgi:hydrogenase small subunit